MVGTGISIVIEENGHTGTRRDVCAVKPVPAPEPLFKFGAGSVYDGIIAALSGAPGNKTGAPVDFVVKAAPAPVFFTIRDAYLG